MADPGPPRPQQFLPPGSPRRSNTAWWWIAGLAFLVSGALVIWLLVSGPSEPRPTSTPIATEPATPAGPADPTPSESVEELWGDFPPLNIDNLKDLSEPDFPEQVQHYTLRSEKPHPVNYIVDYEDEHTVLTVRLLFSKYDYSRDVARWDNAAYVGGAVCGTSASAPDQPICVMAGTGQTMQVGTAYQEVTMEDVAAFTEALYEQL